MSARLLLGERRPRVRREGLELERGGARSAGQKDERHLHARVREAEDGAVRREGGLQRAVGIRLCDNVAAGGAALLRVRDRLINGNQEGMVLN